MRRDEPEPLSILKPLFGRRPDGQYVIEKMAVIPLRPDDDRKTDFYQIREDLFTVQPNIISTILSTLGQSIVPIVALVPGEEAVRCLGTGFFVSADGLLITAAHVLIDPIERNYGGVREIDEKNWYIGDLNLGVMIMTNPVFQPKAWVFRRIEWAGLLAERAEHPLPFRGAELKLTSDIAICKVEDPPDTWLYQPLSVIQIGIRGLGLAVGKKATAIGYAGMKDVALDQPQIGVRAGDFRFNLHVARGEVLEHFPDNSTTRRVRTPGACFSASLKLPSGMSGSPIFDDERIYVHGVVSSGWEDQHGLASHGYGSMLVSSLQMPIRPLGHVSLLDLLRSGKHGMPQISIPDA